MSSTDDFAKRLQATFREEAKEHLATLTAGLLGLEKSPAPADRAAILEKVFRAAHSLKGAARAADHRGIETVCQEVEGSLARIRSGELEPQASDFNVLHDAVNVVGELLELGRGAKHPSLQSTVEALRKGGTTAAAVPPRAGVEVAEETAIPPVQPAGPHEVGGGQGREAQRESVRIPLPVLDSLLRRADELVHVKISSRGCSAALASVVADLEDPRLPADSEGLATLRRKAREVLAHAERHQYQTTERVDQLLEELRKTFLVPCSTLLEVLPKMVRDLSRDTQVEVDVELGGAEVRVDKRVLDDVRDPLIHLLRNAVDHGMEPAEKRLAAGKPARGKIAVAFEQVGPNEVTLAVSDDGRGIDADEVRRAAVRRGVVSQAEASALTDQACLELVFRSDVSTSAAVTSLSGRGIGLAIVKEAVEGLSGTVSIETHSGTGSTFRLRLPVARSTFRGVLVRAGDKPYVLPAADVKRVVRFRRADLRTLQRLPALALESGLVRLLQLQELLGAPPRRDAEPREAGHAVLVEHRRGSAALEVDEVAEEQEVLARPLGAQIVRLRHVAGATVLSTGELVPILRASDLIVSALGFRREVQAETPRRAEKRAKTTVLVVEDSITSRMLLKNVLEAAGYVVRTAVDGVEALSCLKMEEFGLVVSDVDMPRMNGLVLTERIRADARLKELPVVLVTALDQLEDRERGAEAGANAYVVKSGFDQTNLLAIVERLL